MSKIQLELDTGKIEELLEQSCKKHLEKLYLQNDRFTGLMSDALEKVLDKKIEPYLEAFMTRYKYSWFEKEDTNPTGTRINTYIEERIDRALKSVIDGYVISPMKSHIKETSNSLIEKKIIESKDMIENIIKEKLNDRNFVEELITNIIKNK